MKKQKEISVKIILEALDLTGYHLFVNLKINGKKCRFLIDTGASHSVVDKMYFEKYFGKRNLKTVKQATTGLHSSTDESHFGKIKELALGKLVVKNHIAAAVDLSHVNNTYAQIKKPKIQGILGSDILLKYKMIIDYGKVKVIIP
ncbi:MAG: retropepsin-like aspartic protease [Bacteroidota bacterium]